MDRAETAERWAVDPEFKVRFAGKIFVDTPHLLVFKDEPVFSMRRCEEEGILEINFAIFDSSGDRVGDVERGALTTRGESTLELKSGENQFSIKETATGRTVCDIRRRASAKEADFDVSIQMFLPDGFLVHANPAQSNLSSYSREISNVARTADAALRYR